MRWLAPPTTPRAASPVWTRPRPRRPNAAELSAEGDGQELVAPHAARLTAFAIDLAVIGLFAQAFGAGLVLLLAIFVAYHTALVGLTARPSARRWPNLAVRRADDARFQRTWRGLGWALVPQVGGSALFLPSLDEETAGGGG